MAHKIWKCEKCEKILETGLTFDISGTKKICKNCGKTIKKVGPSIEEILIHIETVISKCGNMSYDNKLEEKCKLFRLHNFALPYIPEDYGKKGVCKVLHVGESNYIRGDNYEGNIMEDFFGNDWWDKKIDITDYIKKYPEVGWDGDFTRYVLDSFYKGYSDYFEIFAKPGELLYEKKYGINRDNLKEKGIDIDEYHNNVRELYCRNIAYTDFFKIPCKKKGESIRKMIKTMDQHMMEEVLKNSIDSLNAIIEVLDPDYVLFSSKYGYGFYSDSEYNEKYKLLFENQKRKIISLCHPRVFRYPKKNHENIERWNMAIEEVFNY